MNSNMFLADMEPGKSVIRPSVRGPSFLSLALKVNNGVYAHKEIVEGGEEHKDITSLLRIGTTLKIGEDTFEDLDEVMARYIDPLVGHLKSMLKFRKFRKGTEAEVDELLKIEKAKSPGTIAYCFGISHNYPGTFILTYITSTNPRHEYVGLSSKGFKFRKHVFEKIDELVIYFKNHPQQESGPSIRSRAAMVPMRSHASGRDRPSGHASGMPLPRPRLHDCGRGRNKYNNNRHDSGCHRPRKWDSSFRFSV